MPVPTEPETNIIEAAPWVAETLTAPTAVNAEEPPPPTEPLPIVTAAPVVVAPPAIELPPVPSPSEPPTVPVTQATPEPSPASETPETAPHDVVPEPEPLPVPAVVSERPATPAASTDADAPLTIEAIQQGLASAGFARLETGRLSAVASSLTPSSGDAPATTTDVPKQLDAARTLRREGRLGEALAEYRTLVKAATDRMPEIIRDLRDAAIEAPHEAEVHRLLGDAYIREGDYVEALEAYNRASQLRQDEGAH
jgi:hypothetical protein